MASGHTVRMSIWYGTHVADESELRLCGDLAGKRAIELGVAPRPNSLHMAAAGAKAIAIDPDSQVISSLRAAAERNDVRVECHQTDLADLGAVTSGSCDLVLASHSLSGVDDLPRLLRQVHRVLKEGGAFIVAMNHPVAAMFGSDHVAQFAYGAASRTFGELYMAFERSNFHIDTMHELTDRRHREWVTPSVLAFRARKVGN